MNYLRIFLIFSLLFILPQKNYGQANDFEAGLYNVGIGSILGGIGAIINKEPHEKFGKTLFDGMAQGALGGYLIFESKRLVREFAQTGNYAYVWPSKLVNAAGASIIENAAANGEFLETWHLNIGFNRIEFSTKDKFEIRYRIMPFALTNAITYLSKYKFDIIKSVKMGTLIYKADFIPFNNVLYTTGSANANSIVYTEEKALPHELIHVYQYENFSSINQFFQRLRTFYKSSSLYTEIMDIFYLDLNYLFSQALYQLNSETREDNLFEEEARYYTN